MFFIPPRGLGGINDIDRVHISPFGRLNEVDKMDDNWIYKTVKQYSDPLPQETMIQLRQIADGFAKVKGYVYNRYGGIKGLLKIYSPYTVQNELAETKFRENLGFPTVYFGLAMFSALADIKSMWSNLKRKIVGLIWKNENLTDQERRYLFTVLKQQTLFAKVINRQEFSIPQSFENLALDYKRLNNLLCRLTRRHMIRLAEPENNDYFETYRRAYLYKNGGIYLSTRTPYRRIFIPLTDHCRYTGQLRVQILENKIVLYVPIKTHIKFHEDYANRIGLFLSYSVMAVTSTGNQYGKSLGEFLSNEKERLRLVQVKRSRFRGKYQFYQKEGANKKAGNILRNNLGQKKYDARKQRLQIQLRSYINAEWNRLLKTEKPAEIFAAAAPKTTAGLTQVERQSLAHWQIGYIMHRLEFKCRLNHVTLRVVNPANSGRICAACGGLGKKEKDRFVCASCGAKSAYGVNLALNLLKREDQDYKNPK